MRQALTALIICLCFLAEAQIIYDFSKRTDLDVNELKAQINPVKVGDFVIFKIENINTFRYKVEIEGKNIDYVTPVPSELQALFRIPNEEVTKGVQVAEDAAAQTKSQIPKMNAALTSVKGVDAKLASLSALVSPNSSQQDSLRHLKELEATLNEIITKCSQYVILMEEMADIRFTRMLLIDRSKQKWKDHAELVSNLPKPKQESQMKNDFIDFVKYYYEVEDLYEKAEYLVNKVGTEDEKKAIESATENIDEAYHKVEDDKYLSLIADVITLQTALNNRHYFEVVSPPIQMDGDYIEFEVKAEPINVRDLLPFEQATEFKLEVPGKGGWRADFSVGPTISFGDGARDENFNVVRQDTDSDGIITEADTTGVLTRGTVRDQIRPGIAAMIHAYPRSGKSLNFGIMLGVGAGFQSINDADLSLYVGPTFVLGKRQKLMISGGLSYHNVQRFNEDFVIGNTYDIQDLDTSNFTKPFVKSSAFISISYAIGSRIEVN